MRKKSLHFKEYEEISKRFGKMLGIDPWLINPMYTKPAAKSILLKVRDWNAYKTAYPNCLPRCAKYREYGINEKAFFGG